MIRFALVFENPLGDCHPVLTGTIDPLALPGFLLSLSELNRYLPQLRVIVNGHIVNILTLREGRYLLHGEPTPKWLN